MTGLSRSNLFYMRTFAQAWPEEIVPQAVAQLPWGHIRVLLDKLGSPATRDWYALQAVERGWARSVLISQIKSRLYERTGAAPSNFPARLPAADSDLAQQLTRDPYVLDFLDLTGPMLERDLEEAVFFNWTQSRFVVCELKIGDFKPEYVGKLGFYVSWVDDNLRNPDTHAPTIGILLCAGRGDYVVRYSLAASNQPLAVADYTYATLPQELREAVPAEAELSATLDSVLHTEPQV